MKYVPSIIFGVLAAICFIAAKPTPGGVNANIIMILPGGLFSLIAIVAGLIAWLA